jgi:hypothetical protein
MERFGVHLGDVDRESFFEFCAGYDDATFRILVALLFDMEKAVPLRRRARVNQVPNPS